MPSRTLLVLAAVCALARNAGAQTPPSPATPAGPGSFTIERVEQGIAFVPDARITEVNGRTSALAGGYIGWMTDRTWLVGGGGYWLANEDDDLKMWYGGLVLQWLAHGHERVAFGVKGLVGGGSATLGSTFGEYFGDHRWPVSRLAFGKPVRFRELPHGRDISLGVPLDTPVVVQEYFFVVEPEANVSWQFARWVRLNLGVGYRVTAGAGPLDDELRGVSGSVAVQFGGGKRAP